MVQTHPIDPYHRTHFLPATSKSVGMTGASTSSNHTAYQAFTPQYSAQNRAPQFGSIASTLISVFQPLTEDFTWRFLAQDVIGMWVPRSYNALVRGRYVYNPEEDPEAVKRPFGSQFWHALSESAKNLNWPNFWEEVGREVETGPGVLVAGTVLFGLLATGMKIPFVGDVGRLEAKDAMLLGRSTLKEFNHSFQEVVQHASHRTPTLFSQPNTVAISDSLTQSFYHRMIEPHFVAKRAGSVLASVPEHALRDRTLQGLSQGDQALYHFLYDHVLPKNTAAGSIQAITYQDALKGWGKAWLEMMNQGKEVAGNKLFTWENILHPLQFLKRRNAHYARLNALEAAFNQMVRTYNLTGPMVTDLHLKLPGSALTAADRIVAPYIRVNFAQQPHLLTHMLVEGERHLIPSQEFLRNLEKFHPFVDATVKEAAANAKGNSSQLANWIVKGAQILENRIVKQKAFWGILATLAAGGVVVLVSGLSQSKEGGYKANRTLQLDGLNTKMKTTAQGGER